jgi:hypothetical protein
VLARDLIEHQSPERRQNVKAKVHFAEVPASLICLGIGKVALANEPVQRRDGPQLLTTRLRIGTKQSYCNDRAAQSSSFLNREDISGAKLELPLARAST